MALKSEFSDELDERMLHGNTPAVARLKTAIKKLFGAFLSETAGMAPLRQEGFAGQVKELLYQLGGVTASELRE